MRPPADPRGAFAFRGRMRVATPAPRVRSDHSAEGGLPRAAVRARDPRTGSGRADNGRMMMISSDLPEAIREAAADLDETGRRALATAASAVDVERYPFAVLRYARAVELAERTRAEWQDHGAPLLSTHINGATVIHPLVRLLRDLESDAAAAAKSVFLDPSTAEKRKPGGQVGSARAKDRIGAARRSDRSATGLDPRVYGSMPVFDHDGNPVPLVTKAGEARLPRRAA